jgi:hypothetical protein
MKNIGYVVTAILIIVVVLAIVCTWARRQISTLSSRLQVVEREIGMHLQNLKSAKTTKACLDRKVGILLTAIKLSFCLLISLVCLVLFTSGYDLTAAISGVSDLIVILYVGISYLLLNKFREPDRLVSIIEKRVKLWVYKSSNFEPNRIKEIEYKISQKRREAEEIRSQLITG